MVRFAIDELSLNLDGLEAGDARARFLAFLDLLNDVDAAGHGICYDPDLFSNVLRGEATFWELFSQRSDFALDLEDREIADAVFLNMPRWEDLGEPQPGTVDVQVAAGAVETTGSIAWVHAQGARGLSAAACLSAHTSRQSGRSNVSATGIDRHIWFVTDAAGVEGYFRYLLREHAEKPHHFAELASFAFENLDFVDKCFDGISKMSRSCRDLAPYLVDHLAAFSDSGREIFSGPWQEARPKFGALGVDISDENGNTKSDRKAAKERARNFEGQDLYFWWHSKIERHRDRIHICPDRVRHNKNIIVGIFCEHLRIPG